MGVMVLAGFGIPIMAASNGALGARIGVVGAAAFLFFSAFVLTIVYGVMTSQFGSTGRALPPPQYLIGGVLIVFYLLSITTIGPKIGIGNAVMLVLLGQVISAVLIDHFGLFSMPKIDVNISRISGVLIMMLGIWSAMRK